MNPLELAALKRTTRAFLVADLEEIALQRGSVVPDGAGGWKRNPPVPLPPQECRIIPSTSSRQVERTTLDGKLVTPSAILYGEVGLDVRVGDRFLRWGAEWEVVHLHERSAYQTKADLVRHG